MCSRKKRRAKPETKNGHSLAKSFRLQTAIPNTEVRLRTKNPDGNSWQSLVRTLSKTKVSLDTKTALNKKIWQRLDMDV